MISYFARHVGFFFFLRFTGQHFQPGVRLHYLILVEGVKTAKPKQRLLAGGCKQQAKYPIFCLPVEVFGWFFVQDHFTTVWAKKNPQENPKMCFKYGTIVLTLPMMLHTCEDAPLLNSHHPPRLLVIRRRSGEVTVELVVIVVLLLTEKRQDGSCEYWFETKHRC